MYKYTDIMTCVSGYIGSFKEIIISVSATNLELEGNRIRTHDA